LGQNLFARGQREAKTAWQTSRQVTLPLYAEMETFDEQTKGKVTASFNQKSPLQTQSSFAE